MDRKLTEIEQRESRLQYIKWIVLAIIIIAGGIFILRKYIRPTVEWSDLIVVPVVRGHIENTLSATGQVVPAFETVINASIESEILEVLHRPGDAISKGDKILALNEEFVLLQVEALEDELELKKNNVKRSSIVHQQKEKDLEYQNGILALRIQSLRAGLKDLKTLQGVGGATEEEVEKATLDLEVQELEKKKLENELFYSKTIFESDQLNLELEVSIQQKDLIKLQKQLQQADVRSRSEGIITWINANIGETIQAGDPLVRIADLSHFRIEGRVSDRYGNALFVGQPLVFRIGDQHYDGFVSSIPPSVSNNTLSFVADFNEQPTVELKPNMTVEVFLITESKEAALLLKIGPGYDGGKRTDVFVVRDGYAEKHTVDIGLVNTDFIELLSSAIHEDDQIIISDIEKFDHLERITINR